MVVASQEMHKYFEGMQKNVDECYAIASAARSLGYDPETKVDIKLAKNMAERVEGLISVVAPQIIGSGITLRIIELEKQYSSLDWRVALLIALEVAQEKFCKFKDRREAFEVGIRTGFAYHTGGIVAAPLEGFIELKIKKRNDGKEYFAPCYAGPIRGAGGTAAAFSLIIADFVRAKMGYSKYDPTENEINRAKTEVLEYHERVTNLQYLPSIEELDFLARNLPIEIDGDPTEKIDVFNYKDLPRIETNKIRGGMCLVLAEGLAQKAAKLWKRLSKWGDELGLEWGFLEEFLKIQKQIKARNEVKTIKKEKITPNYTFINDLVAGRPVLTHPMAKGGFRLRYGRNRVSGFSAASINPATMVLLKKYIATGTQLKVERPGKAAAITPCDSIEGPIIKLEDNSVVKINTIEDAKKYNPSLKEILFLGDILFNYGDFSENGHMLVPCGYNEEWWLRELECFFNKNALNTLEKKASFIGISEDILLNALSSSLKIKHDSPQLILISKKCDVPLHPSYTYHWSLITSGDILSIFIALKDANFVYDESALQKIVIKLNQQIKPVLDDIGLPHLVVNNEFIVVDKDNSMAVLTSLGVNNKEDIDEQIKKLDTTKPSLEALNMISGVKIRDKSGTFIGARMGRPEKAKMREMAGSPHMLFPIGEEGGRLRSIQSALEAKKITADFPLYKCEKCSRQTIFNVCEVCGEKTDKRYYCKRCGVMAEKSCMHGKALPYKLQSIEINHYYHHCLKKLKTSVVPELIKGVKGTSNREHIPEHLIKGILRAKHNVYVNKDGTVRFDMSELPITHFKPLEISTSLERLSQLGYTKDIHGNCITSKEQIIEIKPQDIILPAGIEALDVQSDVVLFNVANFIDDLLVNLYSQQPYYNLKRKSDIIGHLVIALAPHISAGMVGRIIGFSNTQGLLAHPLFHASLRRDCDGDEASVSLLLDGLLNFSSKFLPDSRGAKTMDAPLVLTSLLNPAEVDDQAHGLDVVWEYPLELYTAASEFAKPWDIKIEQINKRLGTELQYEGMGFTHDVTNINLGINCSAYKALPSMAEKLAGQMEIAEKIRAVDETDVARLVIEKHFLKDTKGNLRKFSQQQFRCVKCNEKYRRPPLAGRCTKCSGRLLFTVSEGSVVKYLDMSINLAKKYNVPEHMQQTLELLKRRVEGVFGKEKEKQAGLVGWV